MAYFPMFVEMKNKKCLIIGGGKVAYRKAQVMLDFEAEVSLIAPLIIEEIKRLPNVFYKERAFTSEDLEGQEVVIAATDDKELNHKISIWCKEHKVPVNVVDQEDECTFIFPAYLKTGQVVSAFSSGGQGPVITQYLKRQMSPYMTENLGNVASYMGRQRAEVKAKITQSEAKRKEVYERLLQIGLEEQRIPTRKEFIAILETIQNEIDEAK